MCDTPEPHVCFSCVRFPDGSAHIMPLCIGSLEECRKIQEIVPAVAYNGPEKPKDAFIGIASHEKWCKAWARHGGKEALDEPVVGG